MLLDASAAAGAIFSCEHDRCTGGNSAMVNGDEEAQQFFFGLGLDMSTSQARSRSVVVVALA